MFREHDCDLLIALGVRFDDRVTGKLAEFAKHAKIVHIDIDPSELNKNKTAHIPVVSDVKFALEELNKIVEPPEGIGPWVKHVHLKDADQREDGSFELKLLGEGNVPNYEVVKLLIEKGYDGYLSAEWEKKWHPTIEEPEVAIPQHAEVIRGWLEELGNK